MENKTVRMRPLTDWVLIRPIEQPKESRSIIIPRSAKERKPLYLGDVLAVGPGNRHPKDGRRLPVYARAGMRVFYFNDLVDESIEKGDRILGETNLGNQMEVTVDGEKLVCVPDDWVWVEVENLKEA